MISKQFFNICIITIIMSCLGSCSTPQNTSNNILKKNNNSKQVNKKDNSIIDTIKKSAHDAIVEDTKNRSKSQTHIASYLPANLPQQLIICMENALRNNEQIKEAQKEILASHEEHNISRSALMPSISASTKLSNANEYKKGINENNDTTPFSKTKTIAHSASLQVEYNLFHGGADIANLKSTDKSIEAKWKNYDAIIQNVLREVAQKYFEVVTQQEKIKNIKYLLNAMQESKRVARQMVEAGTAKELDVAQADAGYLDAQSRLYNAEAEEKISRASLKQLTGVEVTEKLEAPDKIFDKKFTKEEALNIAIKNNPKVISLIAEQAAAKAKLSTVNKEFLPEINVKANLSRTFSKERRYDIYDHTKPVGTDTKILGYTPIVSLEASLPIFNGGSSFSRRVQQAYNVAKVAITKDRLYKEIENGITQAIESLEASENNIKTANEMIKSYRTILESTKKEYEAGTKITKDVLEAQQKLFEAHSILTNAINNRYIQQCKLMEWLGWFNPSDLKLKGLTFDYKKEYYRQIQRILPTFEEMGIETKKPVATNNKQKKVYNNTNTKRIN